VSATRVAVLRFPGTLDHESAARAVEGTGGEPVYAHHEDAALPAGTRAVVIPGGFSYGDHLRPGALASRTPIMGAVRAHAADGGKVLGICNGFQILCESGLLPGVLRPNASLSFICRQADLQVADSGTPWTAGRNEGEVLSIPFKHHDGAWFGDPGEARVVLRYAGENPNGSIDKVAGISNLGGNVMGLMPHPEEAQEPLLGSVDGRVLFAALLS